MQRAVPLLSLMVVTILAKYFHASQGFILDDEPSFI